MLGGLFVLVTLLLPKGIVGTLASLFRRERRPAPGEATPPLTPAAREDLPPAATNPAAAE
jgi:hypothetical protein